jgi:hypothetical protein
MVLSDVVLLILLSFVASEPFSFSLPCKQINKPQPIHSPAAHYSPAAHLFIIKHTGYVKVAILFLHLRLCSPAQGNLKKLDRTMEYIHDPSKVIVQSHYYWKYSNRLCA